MIPRVRDVRHVRDHVLYLRFTDGRAGEVDLSQELEGEIFEPLKDVACFKRVSVHPELHTLTRPNGADFTPEFLYDLLRVHA